MVKNLTKAFYLPQKIITRKSGIDASGALRHIIAESFNVSQYFTIL